MENATRILQNLWIGNYLAAADEEFLISNNITCVVNCTKTLPFAKCVQYKYRIPVDDSQHESDINTMTSALPIIVNIIKCGIESNKRFLVHCHAGMQRSAIVVLSLLYHYSPIAKNEIKCYSYLRKRRPIVFKPNVNFKRSFDATKHFKLFE